MQPEAVCNTDTYLPEPPTNRAASQFMFTVRAGHGPAAEAGQKAPPVVVVRVAAVLVRAPAAVVRVPAVPVRVPAVVVRVFPLAVGGSAAVLFEVAVPRQTARAVLPSVGGPLAADQASSPPRGLA
jgi:hypothetical protein